MITQENNYTEREPLFESVKRWSFTLPPQIWRLLVMLAACAIIYYLPNLIGFTAWAYLQPDFNRLHDLSGIDVYALLFFVPVVYVAYKSGVIEAVTVALVAMLILMPYSFLSGEFPTSLVKPSAFVIILSAVGAVVAMLQRSDEQRRRGMGELRCLYEVGKAIEESSSLDEFARASIEIIRRDINIGKAVNIKLTIKDKEYRSPDFSDGLPVFKQNLIGGGEKLGTIEIYSREVEKQRDLIGTLARRLGSGIHEIELQTALEEHYENIENMVEERTRDLEQIQEKLIRSERLAAVGELASGVGHELRNPLNVIRNCVYLLNLSFEGKESNEEVLSTLGLLDRQVDIANRIVTDLLDFTRVRAPTLAKLDIAGVIKESLSWVSVPRHVSVKTEFDVVPAVYLDGEQVGRAFANIISNAYQAMTKEGELKISAKTDNKSAIIRFEDTGCGIPPENMKRIFEPLFSTKPKGIGLGLAITRRMIEQNKGEIEVTSQIGQGTIFTVRLPLYTKENSNETAK